MATQGKSPSKRSSRKNASKTATTSHRSEAANATRRPKGPGHPAPQRGVRDTTRKAATKAATSPAAPKASPRGRKPRVTSTTAAAKPAARARREHKREAEPTERISETASLPRRLVSHVKDYQQRSQAAFTDAWNDVVPSLIARTRAVTDRCRGLLTRVSHMLTTLHLPSLHRTTRSARDRKPNRAIPLPAAAALFALS